MNQAFALILGLVAAPTAVLSADSIGVVERYGIAGLLGLGSVLCFRMWRAAEDAHREEHRKRIAALEAEITQLREDLRPKPRH